MTGGRDAAMNVWVGAAREALAAPLDLRTAEGRAALDDHLATRLDEIEDESVRYHAKRIVRGWRRILLGTLDGDPHRGDERDAPRAREPSRRDVAAAAMNGMLAHSTRYRPRDEDAHLHWHDALAREAYDLADAMLRAEEAGL